MTDHVRPRVLFVDDDITFRRHGVRALTAGGFDCDPVSSVAEALARLGESDYELVVTDLHMPQVGGIELLRHLRESGNEVPVVLITGDPSLATAIEALRLDAVDYVLKPVADLDVRIRDAFARAQRRGAVAPADPTELRIRSVSAMIDRLEDLVSRTSVDLAPPPMPMPRPPLPHESANRVSSLPPTRLGNGPRSLPPPPTPPAPKVDPGHALSSREREIADLVAGGVQVSDVATRLALSQHTVRNHLKSVYRKLGVRSQVELVLALR